VDIIFGAVEGVHGPQNTPMLWQCIKLGGLSPIHLMRWRGAHGFMWGARGPFLPAAAMVPAVVTPIVFCAKATEILKNAKNTKISCFYRIILSITIFVKHIKIHVSLIIAWPNPELLGSPSPNHFCPMDPGILGIAGRLLYRENDSHIVLRPKCRNIGEREKRLSTLYLELLIILDFGFFSEWFLCLCPVFYGNLTV
jgi:hypothetical protein